MHYIDASTQNKLVLRREVQRYDNDLLIYIDIRRIWKEKSKNMEEVNASFRDLLKLISNRNDESCPSHAYYLLSVMTI